MKINREDLILYGVCIVVLAFLAYYFVNTQSRLEASIFQVGDDGKGTSVYTQNPLALKYLFAEKALLSNAARINMSFLIGSILCMLGAMIVIRRVRTEASNLEAGNESFKFNIQSNSPGLLIAFMGAIIILFSIYYKDQYRITDGADGGVDAHDQSPLKSTHLPSEEELNLFKDTTSLPSDSEMELFK